MGMRPPAGVGGQAQVGLTDECGLGQPPHGLDPAKGHLDEEVQERMMHNLLPGYEYYANLT
jgi:hypothetical protein